MSTVLALALVVPLSALVAQRPDSSAYSYPAAQCASCDEWNAPTPPRRLFGNTYYVGTRGLSAILLTSPRGHILVDAGLPQSASRVAASIRALGFRVEDVKLIVTSHAHFDHVGGVAALQRASGAEVAASPWSAEVLRRGASVPGDPQFGIALGFPPVARVREIADGDTLRVGTISIVAHFTPGHTPGGTSWTWRSCESAECLDFVYADSQTPVSADGFEFTSNSTYRSALWDFQRSAQVLDTLACDVLLTPHPGASSFWERIEARDHGQTNVLRDPQACRRYATGGRAQLAQRIAAEDSAHVHGPRADSGLVEVVLQAVLRELSPDLAWAIVRPAVRPWRIKLPHGAVWDSAATRVARVLGARVATDADALVHFLSVREDTSADSLHVYDVHMGQLQRCRGVPERWMESGEEFDVRAVYAFHAWQRDHDTPVVMLDPGVCAP